MSVCMCVCAKEFGRDISPTVSPIKLKFSVMF
jgi:hypothetical protein